MNEQMDLTIVELTDQSGRTFQFRYVMAMEVAGKTYVVLSELEPQNAQQEDELLFLRVEKTADGLDEYALHSSTSAPAYTRWRNERRDSCPHRGTFH